MYRAVLAALFLLGQGCLYMIPNSPPTPVRKLLLSGVGMCSAVVVSPSRAYTAGHCLDSTMTLDGMPVKGAWAGPDLARLTGQFRGPYARVGPLVSQRLLVEGYGCNRRGDTRQVLLVAYRPGQPAWGGLELAFDGRICNGDSGGAVWSQGVLAGIITARDANPESVRGYGTDLDVPILDLDDFLAPEVEIPVP